MKNLEFVLYREKYLTDRTLGKLFLNDSFYGYTLEDTARPKNVKIAKETAIQEGKYILYTRHSSRFDELRVFLKDVPNFKGIQIHGGNGPEDTEGCILLAKNEIVSKNLIQGSLKNYITELVKDSEYATIEIINLNQL